jgi:hypothetical protein
MSTSWDEASQCPDDQFTGKVINRKPIRGQGTLVTLECPNERCQYHETGWVVQVRPDNTIPDKLDLSTREKQYRNTMTEAAKQQVRDALAQQVLDEMKPGSEVRSY